MELLLQNFRNEILQIYKQYRLSHFSLYIMKNTYNQYSSSIKNFKIFDTDLDENIIFSESEMEMYLDESGFYQRILAGSTISSFYHLWEYNFRLQIAKKCNCEIREVESEIFFELGKIRHACVKNNFEPINDLKRIKCLGFFGDENVLNLTSYEDSNVFVEINKEIDRLHISYIK